MLRNITTHIHSTRPNRHGGGLALALLGLWVVDACVPAQASEHPSALYNTSERTTLRNRRTQSTWTQAAGVLAATLDARQGRVVTRDLDPDPRLAGNALGGLAVAADLLERPADLDLARRSLLGALGWSDWGFGEGDDLNRAHMLIGSTLAYDVLWPILSADERTRVRTRLASEAARLAAAVDTRVWWTSDLMQNHNWINHAALGLAGRVLADEDPRAAGWIQRAMANEARVFSALDLITDGSWHEGVGYQQYGWSMALPFWLASRRSGVAWRDPANLLQYGKYRWSIHLPDAPRTYIATHGDWSGWAGEGTLPVLRYVARYGPGPTAARMAQTWASAGRRSSQAWDSLYQAVDYVLIDPSVAPAPAPAPLDTQASDQGLAVLRTGWSPGSLTVGFKTGVLGGRATWERMRAGGGSDGTILNVGHDHIDDLGLWMHGDGQWLLPECVGYNIGRTAAPPAWQTLFHNSLLIDGIGQLGDDRGGVHDAAALPWFWSREGALQRVESTAHIGRAIASGAGLYAASSGLQGLLREVVLDREAGAVLVRDRLAFDRPRPVTQLWHVLDGASRDGAWTQGVSKSGRLVGLWAAGDGAATVTIGSQTADKLTKAFEPDGQVSLIQHRWMPTSSAPAWTTVVWPGRVDTWATRPAAASTDTMRPGASVQLGRDLWLFESGGVTGSWARMGGDLAVVRTRPDHPNELERVVLGGDARLYDGAGTLMSASTGPGLVELRRSADGAAVEVSGAPPEGLMLRSAASDLVFLREGQPLAARRVGDVWVLGTVPADWLPVVEPPPVSGGDTTAGGDATSGDTSTGTGTAPSEGSTGGGATDGTDPSPDPAPEGEDKRPIRAELTVEGCAQTAGPTGWIAAVALLLRRARRTRRRVAPVRPMVED